MKKFLRKLVLRATLCGAGLACALAAHAEGAALLLRLHAWDGKSDPSKDPAFVLQEDGTYLLENQKCYPGMEFGIRNCDPASNSQTGWYGGYSQHIVPNAVYKIELTNPSSQEFPNNWIITEEGTYDFKVTVEQGSYNTYEPLTLTVSRHSAADGWKLLSTPMAQLSTGTKFQKVQDTNSFYFTRPDGTKMVPAGTFAANTAFTLTEGESSTASLQNGDVAMIDDAGEHGFIYRPYLAAFSLMGREGGSGDFTVTKTYKFDYNLTELEQSDYDSYYTGTAMMVKVPDNFEFYILHKDLNDPNATLEITPAAASGATLTNNKAVAAAISEFGGPGSTNSCFKIEKGGNYMLFFDASTMQVKIFKPNTAPWLFASNTYPKDLWLHGNLKLESGEINDWGGYHDELKLTMGEMPDEYSNDPLKYSIDLNLTGDSYFRVFTANPGLTGIWTMYKLNSLPYFDEVRGCWAPASNYNVDLPEVPEAAVASWSKTTPDDGTMYHLPAGKWRVFVKYALGRWGHYDPNSIQLYAERILEDGEEVPPVYVLVTQGENQYANNYSTFTATGDGSYRIKTDRLTFKIYQRGEDPEDQYSNREDTWYIPVDTKTSVWGDEIPDYDVTTGVLKRLKSQKAYSQYEEYVIKGAPGTYLITFNPTTMEMKVERDYSAVNMPLLPADFTDADGKPKTHYFVVGSRTADFRLLPEWELTAENGYRIENRLMYPGMLGIAAVDNYEDYIQHKFRFYHIADENNSYVYKYMDSNYNDQQATIYSGKVLNEAGSYTLTDTDGLDKDITATAVKNYGNYYSSHNSALPWPFVVCADMYGADMYNSSIHNKISSWWHFNGFQPGADGKYTRQILAEAFKKGTPSLASSIGITLDKDGKPATLEIGEVKTWENNKSDILAEVNFMLCGDDIVNENDITGRHALDPQKTSLFGYTNVNEWANQWIQYDPQSGDPYVDGDGKYLFQTVYQTSWMKDHPVIFHRKADNTDYNSNSLVFSPVTDALTADADNFVDYYNGMKNVKLGDGTRKTSTEGTSIAWDFEDQVGKPDPHVGMAYGPGTLDAPNDGWKPYVLSDISFGGMFKVWSGFGGGHAGYGSWTDQVEVGDGYAWFNLNVGHSMARNPLRVKAQTLASSVPQDAEVPAPADPNIDAPGAKVNFYLTGKDEPAADFMTYYDDANESYPLRSYRRLILWLNTSDRTELSDNATSGMAKSYVQLVVTDLTPVIKGKPGTAERQIVSAWHLQDDYTMESKTVSKAVVTMFRDGKEIDSYEETEAAGMKAEDCTEEGKFPHTWNDLVAGEYWFRIEVTYDDGNMRSSLSNHLYLFDKIEPALLTAWQRTATDAADAEGRTLYGFNVSGKVSLPEGADNRPFKEYKDNEGHSRTMLLKDLISGYTLTVKELGRDAETVNVEYTPGTESEFLLKLHGTTRVAISAQAVAKPSPVTVNGVAVDLTEKELNLLKYTLASTSVEMVLPTPGAEVSDFTVATVEYDSETDQAGHPGHASYAPVRYRNANSLNARVAVNDNVLLEDGETAVYAVTAAEGSVGEVTDGVAEATRLPVAMGEDNKPVSDNTITVAATYSRDNALLTSVTAETQAQHTFDMVAPATIEVLPEDMAITGINNRDSSNPGTICDLLIYVPSSINDGASLPDEHVILGGFAADAADYTTDEQGHDAWGEVPGQRQDTPKVKAPMAWNFQGYNNAYETAKYPDGFPGLQGSSSLNCGFSEYNGTGWGIENDWAHAIAREGFAMSFRHALFVPKTISGDLLNKAFTVKTYNVYPFLVDTPDTPAAEAAATAVTADARAAATRVVPLSLEGEIKVPAKNWASAVVSGIADTYADSDEKVDVYTPSGIRLMEGVTRAEALTRLEPGIYLIGSDKVVVK